MQDNIDCDYMCILDEITMLYVQT